ncbi:MAG: sialate O-acetylesterase [Chitinophagaceae bacterium]|nr:sialate O-acetylesterase [Chitinophagaceae bacterium]
MKKNICAGTILLFAFISVQANVTLPALFADNMVLQRNAPIPVWGWADANEKVEVKFHNQVKTTRAGKSGKWMVKLDMENAGGPYDLLINGKNALQFKNVLVGEVWICSGQSNMEWTVGQSANAKAEIAAANYPMIRHIKIQHAIGSLPKTTVTTDGWKVCDSTTVGAFTGIGYFFARNLFHELNIPVGLINSSWGGTNIETWISREGFEGSEEFKEMIAGMPRIDLDSLSKGRVVAVQARIEALQGAKLGSLTPGLFMQPTFDDAKWPVLFQPQLWEQQSIGEMDGVVWLRKTITLPSLNFNKESVLELATIDDEDVTYVNGIRVGSKNQYNAPRKYTIPAGVLKPGKNVIAVRVVDNGGGGGIYGNEEEVRLVVDNNTIPLKGEWKFQVESILSRTSENSLPSLCYNAMIHPLIPYAFKGVLWYQGESNAGRSYQYRKAFPLLINDWRAKWNNAAMPFYFVQLATFKTIGKNSNEGSGWAELREAQTMALQLPNTGMVVTTDLGNPNDIHPTNKQDVGKRMAAIALNNLYSKPMICNGPTYTSMQVSGSQAVLTFENIGSGLSAYDKYGYVKGFEIAGKTWGQYPNAPP